MNGCEIADRGPYPAPGVMSGMFGVQNRARAPDNIMFVIAMNLGTYYLDADSQTPIDTFSGGFQIVDYRGRLVTEVPYGAGSTWIAGTLDVEALGHFRASAQWDNWLKDLTTEQYALIYEQPVYPRNLYLDRPPTATRTTASRSPSARSNCSTTVGSGLRPPARRAIPELARSALGSCEGRSRSGDGGN